MRTSSTMIMIALLAAAMPVSRLYANKTSVSMECPDRAAAGSEITIRVNAAHHGNNFLHYTDWVRITINGTEIARWNFSAFNRPQAENFTREVKYRITGPAEVAATGNCNLHGSAGNATKRITVP